MTRNATKANFKHLCEENIKPRVNSRKNAYSGHTVVLKDKEQIIRDQLQVCDTLNDFLTSTSRALKK